MGPSDGFTPEFRAQLFTVPQAAVAAANAGQYGQMLDQVLGEQPEETLTFLSNFVIETAVTDSTEDDAPTPLSAFGTEVADDWT